MQLHENMNLLLNNGMKGVIEILSYWDIEVLGILLKYVFQKN